MGTRTATRHYSPQLKSKLSSARIELHDYQSQAESMRMSSPGGQFQCGFLIDQLANR